MTQPQYDVLVVGGAGVDTVVRVDALALPPGDSVSVPPVHDYVAHTGNGVALGWHALGLATKFIDFLGDDPQGRAVLAHYAGLGLDFSHVVSEHGTPRGVNLVDAEGRRFSFYDARHPADLRLPRDFYLPHLRRARHVHLSITGTNRDMYEDVHRLGLSCSTDLHDWDGSNPHHRTYALASDYVFLSAAAIHHRLDEVLHTIVDRGRARLALATDGAAGCHLLVRGEREVRHFAAVRPERPVVDSNGAGDAFVTAFLYALFEGRPYEECVLAGSVSGAFACGSAGTHTEFIDLSGLRAACARAAGSLR
ncbi:carbohydrate kinase family protein [Streptomyces sp. NA04227]|uniref:carbohydrate kinase family protein n=1 Tax=Streptomyces sp. NA04227 TaxID=2742136 RepID=UPI001590B7C6|nr:carbohydrate kinase family protein [Streptomyces sp. NA04227]QKW05058.1 carbohydrate kinase family protein [Streptomyces sp. NA04227]